jgi:hypothetical protein
MRSFYLIATEISDIIRRMNLPFAVAVMKQALLDKYE